MNYQEDLDLDIERLYQISGFIVKDNKIYNRETADVEPMIKTIRHKQENKGNSNAIAGIHEWRLKRHQYNAIVAVLKRRGVIEEKVGDVEFHRYVNMMVKLAFPDCIVDEVVDLPETKDGLVVTASQEL